MDDIQEDLSPLVKPLAPNENVNGAQIPFMMASEGIKERNIVHQLEGIDVGAVAIFTLVCHLVYAKGSQHQLHWQHLPKSNHHPKRLTHLQHLHHSFLALATNCYHQGR
ncbi:methyltransferase-like protein 13 isoform X1 [Sesbania bispinosa]|nr:methyltransferase-like protein 13 isoform X1 [Sesbania bispinosa]